MKKELPVRHWATLPEAAIIPDLLTEAAARVAEMVRHSEGTGSAAEFVPGTYDLASLRDAARGCTACGRCSSDAPPVFGRGPDDARVVLVGDRPDDGGLTDELLATALAESGFDRSEVYLTHVVKRPAPGGPSGTRESRKAEVREAAACRPWLTAELGVLEPAVVVCLGHVAACAALGPLFRFTEHRGEIHDFDGRRSVIATHHPAAILRAPAAARPGMQQELVAHLSRAREIVGSQSCRRHHPSREDAESVMHPAAL